MLRLVYSAAVFGAAMSMSACADRPSVPDIEPALSAEAAAADWPAFMPIEQIVGPDQVLITEETAAMRALMAQTSRLEERAKRLRRLPANP